MNILGLHFGHDAGVAVVRDGMIVCHVLRERHTRVEHAMTLDLATMERALEAAGLAPSDIDFCAITSTQHVELIVDQPDRLKITLARHPRDAAPSTIERVIAERGANLDEMLKAMLLPIVYDTSGASSIAHRTYRHYFPEHRSKPRDTFRWVGWLDDYVSVSGWDRKPRLDQLAATNAAAAAASDDLRRGFHLPVSVELDGSSIPGCFVHHQLCHAASSYYRSGLPRALILTHDGYSSGATYQSGMFYYGDGHRLVPLAPHHLAIGVLYDAVGHSLHLGDTSVATKLMGLAPYGLPRLFDRRFVGNWYDAEARFNGHYAAAWLVHCRQLARKKGYDLGSAAAKECMTDPVNADIAASTQKLLEETMLAAVEALDGLARTSGLPSEALCLSGSVALNAASNSRIVREGPFARVFVGPACDDSGLAIGAALAAYHNVFDQALETTEGAPAASAYLGAPFDAAALAAMLEAVDAPVVVQAITDAPERAARDLSAGKVIGWFEGRSEIGSYALGHRSILGDPREAATMERIGRIAGRETWQPLSAAILETETAEWFAGVPATSPYGLYAGVVRSAFVPAITQKDGTARIQTVDEASGDLFHVLRAFYVLTRVPLVVNAPLGRVGEPLIETPTDALRLFATTELDTLYLGGYRIARRAAAKATGKATAKKTETTRAAKRPPTRPRRRTSA